MHPDSKFYMPVPSGPMTSLPIQPQLNGFVSLLLAPQAQLLPNFFIGIEIVKNLGPSIVAH